jgi:Protein of unknown function (DUF4244)
MATQPNAAPDVPATDSGRERISTETRRPGGDAGMATAEYAVATLAACGFAGLLVAVLSGGEVRAMLLSIVKRALTIE